MNSGLRYVLYLQYVFPVVQFMVRGAWVKVIIVLYFIVLAYDMMVVKLTWSVYSALPSSLHFGRPLTGTIDNCTFDFSFLESIMQSIFLHLLFL